MNRPNHIALLLKGHKAWNKGELSDRDLYEKVFTHTKKLIDWQVKQKIPIMTINLLSDRISEHDNFGEVMDALEDYFNSLLAEEVIFKKKIKISVFGKWYDLPPKTVDAVKRVIDETKDYDSFFFNICVNYNGKTEIVDATKIVALKVVSGRAAMNSIDDEMVKDTIYSSSFLPPDLVIKTGLTKKLYGFLLWDATHAHIHFSNKKWLDFKETDFKKAIKEWEKGV